MTHGWSGSTLIDVILCSPASPTKSHVSICSGGFGGGGILTLKMLSMHPNRIMAMPKARTNDVGEGFIIVSRPNLPKYYPNSALVI